MKVCVQGLWHLGSVTAGCLSTLGHDVTGLDFDSAAVESLARGSPPVAEPGLDAVLRKGLDAGNLRFTTDAAAAVSGAAVLWVAYDTPVDEDDAADVDFIVAQIERVVPLLAEGAVVLVSSQMPVGSIRRLERLAEELRGRAELGFACSPENLRLGKALDVFLRPDRVIVGVRNAHAKGVLERLLEPLAAKVEWMSVESAEMTKHAINAFLATSVTFANEVASICEFVGADAKEVERGLKTESRIGPRAYLSPGGAFAGGTLARDIAFLGAAASAHDLAVPLLASVRLSNETHKHWPQRRLCALFSDISSITVAVWGLTYKPGTDTLRRSSAVELCNWLIARKVNLRVHDPAVRRLPDEWKGMVRQYDDPLAAAADADALVIATEWPVYQAMVAGGFPIASKGLAVLDANRFLPGLASVSGVRYVSVGAPVSTGPA